MNGTQPPVTVGHPPTIVTIVLKVKSTYETYPHVKYSAPKGKTPELENHVSGERRPDLFFFFFCGKPISKRNERRYLVNRRPP